MPASVLVFLIIGLVAASQSGNIVRLGDAHPAAIAAWRLVLASAVLWPLALKQTDSLRRLSRRELLLLVLTGLALCGHFLTWIAAIQQTTVANAASLLAVAPVIAAAGGRLIFKERYSAWFVIALLLGAGGVAVITGADVGAQRGHIWGDVLAIACAVLFAVYLLLGQKLRPLVPTRAYTAAIYTVAAALCLVTMVWFDAPLLRYDGRTWLCFGLMALVPTLIGHTAINAALRHIDAGRMAVATLTEPPLAAAVAYFAWAEPLKPAVVIGFGAIALSVYALLRDRAHGALGSGAKLGGSGAGNS